MEELLLSKYFTNNKIMEPIDTQLFGVIHTAKKINSKVKGNRNELAVCKILTEWTGHEFVRVPMSGGLRWKNRMDICGDVINVDPTFNFPFSVETKAVANLGIQNKNILRENSVIYTYFDQCHRDADAAGKRPFLMVRQNNMSKGSYYIFLSLSIEMLMKIKNYTQPIVFTPEIRTQQFLWGFKSEYFFKEITYKQLKWIYNGE
jgi:hypothetical protein